MKCTLIGHRDYNGSASDILEVINNLIKEGVTEFLSGGMGNFDKSCEKIVKLLGGTLIFVPYNSKQIKPNDKIWYNSIICPFGNKSYSKFDISKRNRYLVDNCDICLCWVYKSGGTKHTLDYAIKNNKTIINLYSKN